MFLCVCVENSGFYEDAIGYLEQQLGTLERVNSSTAQLDRARALGHLADCYDALNDFEEGNLKYFIVNLSKFSSISDGIHSISYSNDCLI